MIISDENMDFSLLERATERLRAAVIPAGPDERLLQETAQAMRQVRGSKQAMIRILTIAAAILLAVGGWLWRSGGAELAFADVSAAVARTTTLRTTLVNNPDDPNQRSSAQMFIKGSLCRIQGDDGDIDISDDSTGDDLNLQTRSKTAMHSVTRIQGDDFFSQWRQIAASVPKPIGPKIINGRTLDGFSGTVDMAEFKNLPVDVWVDPASKLPVRIEILSAPGGQIVTLFNDIRFDIPLDDSLFNRTVPAGYRFIEEGGLTRAELDALPAATAGQIAQLVLKPGWGMGSLPFSATRDQIVAALGKPAKPDIPGVLSYPALGLTLTVDDPPRGFKQVKVESAATAGGNIRDFPGRTQEGIRIGSSREDVEKAYGAADQVNTMGDAFAELDYRKLGIVIFSLNDHVSSITMFVPNPQPVVPRDRPATMPVPQVLVPLPVNPGPAPTQAELQRLILKPGVGIGDLKFGATREQIIAEMGQPQGVTRRGTSDRLQYSACGLVFYVDPQAGLRGVSAFRLLDSPKLRPFSGWTDKQIHLGSTADEIHAAYGKEDNVIQVSVLDHPEIHEIQWNYLKLGMIIFLDTDKNACVGIGIEPPTTLPAAAVPSGVNH